MASTVTRNVLIREITELLKTRGYRMAANPSSVGTASSYVSDSFRVYTHVSGNLSAPAGTIYRIVIDLVLATLTTQDEKVHAAQQNLIPSTTRI